VVTLWEDVVALRGNVVAVWGCCSMLDKHGGFVGRFGSFGRIWEGTKCNNNLNISIKRQWLELERCLFLNFSQGSQRRSECTCRSDHTTAKRVGKLIFGDGLHDPYPACLEAILGQQEASHLDFTLGKRKKFAGIISSE
jgi:hypothetical protein